MNTDVPKPDPEAMTQLQGQRVISATLKFGDPAMMVRPGTRATLVWLRSYLPDPGPKPKQETREELRDRLWRNAPRPPVERALRHEYEAYAFNDLWHFVRVQVNSDQIEDVFFPQSE